MLLFYPLNSLIHFPIDHTDLRERALVYVRMETGPRAFIESQIAARLEKCGGFRRFASHI